MNRVFESDAPSGRFCIPCNIKSGILVPIRRKAHPVCTQQLDRSAFDGSRAFEHLGDVFNRAILDQATGAIWLGKTGGSKGRAHGSKGFESKVRRLRFSWIGCA